MHFAASHSELCPNKLCNLCVVQIVPALVFYPVQLKIIIQLLAIPLGPLLTEPAVTILHDIEATC